MLIILKTGAADTEIDEVKNLIIKLGFTPTVVPGPTRSAVCITGNQGSVEESLFTQLPAVKEVLRVTKPYKLVSREVKPDDTVIQVGSAVIGGKAPVIMAGPCSVETPERTLEVAKAVKSAGASVFRAGAYKPRTSPYAFQGLGIEGLKILADVRDKTGLPFITEVVDTESADAVIEYADILQVGTRNMYNYSLLKKLGRAGKPVMLKRGLSATVEEWLNSAEYIITHGNPNVILCERGIRTFSQHSRNTLDLNVVPHIRELSHLPIVVDPSHGVGKRRYIRDLSRASLASGAHGIIVEAHTEPNTAYSDGAQTIDITTLSGIVRDTAILNTLERI